MYTYIYIYKYDVNKRGTKIFDIKVNKCKVYIHKNITQYLIHYCTMVILNEFIKIV